MAVAILAGTISVTACFDSSQEPRQIIELATSLQVDARMASQNQQPIIIFVSQHGCKFCHLLRDQVLHPMIKTGVLQSRAILREISLDDGFRVIDFDAKDISGRELAERYETSVTPTLLFLDDSGREVSDRIVGISNIDYYEFYLDKAIETATTEITKG